MAWQDGKSLSQVMAHLCLNSAISDVRFTFLSEPISATVHAHKFVLAARSAVFEKMFYGSLTEADEVKITDISRVNFELLLRYIYTDNVKLTGNNILGLLQAAQKYQIMGLIEKCESFLQTNMSADSACTIYASAFLYNMKNLLSKSRNFIDENASNVMNSKSWNVLSIQNISSILDSDNLNAPEVDIFKAVLEWASAECKRRNIEATTENKRLMLGDVFYKVRIPTMPLEDFRKHVVDTRILSEHEELEMFRIITASSTQGQVSMFCMKERQKRPFIIVLGNSVRMHQNDYGWGCDTLTLSLHSSKDLLLVGIGFKHPVLKGTQFEILLGDENVLATVRTLDNAKCKKAIQSLRYHIKKNTKVDINIREVPHICRGRQNVTSTNFHQHETINGSVLNIEYDGMDVVETLHFM